MEVLGEFCMNTKEKIDGKTFERIICGGAQNLQTHVQEVNDLNVFPIPDGDTGENMYLTLKGGIEELKGVKNQSLEQKANALAQGMLLNARGNSGVILSQLFYGLAQGLSGLEEADLNDFAKALVKGVKCAYGSVAKPVEGTILTVARESAEFVAHKTYDDASIESFFAEFLTEMQKSLEKTPDLLQTLKEAGVIDSGGAGLLYITEGFKKAIEGDVSDEIAATADTNNSKSIDLSKFDENSVMKFGYCTELLLRLQTCKTDIENFDVQPLIDFLSTLGDSIVAFKTGSAVKIHVHTLTPYKVLEYCHQFGEFLTVKIENMTLQHNETENKEKDSIKTRVKRARRKYALVTVAQGEGIKQTFLDMGADYVICGGQTNNPSAEDFIDAFDEVNADYVFVLPNNGNIVLAAKQAAKMYKDSEIRVIESKNIGQGYSALSMLDYGCDNPDKIEENLRENFAGVITGMVSKAVRTTTVNGIDINEGDYIGFTDKEMRFANADKIQTALGLVEKLELAEKSFLITIFGVDASEKERQEFEQTVMEKYPQVEVYSIDGGQEVYDFLMIIE